MPASWASAGVGYWQLTHGISLEHALHQRAELRPGEREPLRRRSPKPSRVFSGASIAIQRVHVLQRVPVDRRRLGEQLLRRFAPPRARSYGQPPKLNAQDRVRAAPRDLARELLEQRPGERRRADEHLPARLDVEAALDEQAGVLLDAWIHRRPPTLSKTRGADGAPLSFRLLLCLAPADDQLDREAPALDRARPRALADHAADSPSSARGECGRPSSALGGSSSSPVRASAPITLGTRQRSPAAVVEAEAGWWWRRWRRRRWRWGRRWRWRRWGEVAVVAVEEVAAVEAAVEVVAEVEEVVGRRRWRRRRGGGGGARRQRPHVGAAAARPGRERRGAAVDLHVPDHRVRHAVLEAVPDRRVRRDVVGVVEAPVRAGEHLLRECSGWR